MDIAENRRSRLSSLIQDKFKSQSEFVRLTGDNKKSNLSFDVSQIFFHKLSFVISFSLFGYYKIAKIFYFLVFTYLLLFSKIRIYTYIPNDLERL